jgi:hypothetical protein
MINYSQIEVFDVRKALLINQYIAISLGYEEDIGKASKTRYQIR